MARNAHVLALACAVAVVAACSTPAAAADACKAGNSPWSGLFGNAQYTAFVSTSNPASVVPPSNWTRSWNTTGGAAWVPTHSGGGGNIALSPFGTMFVGAQPAGGGPGVAVIALDATTGATTFVTKITQLTGNVVLLLDANNTLVVVGPYSGSEGGVGVVVVDPVFGAVLRWSAFYDVKISGDGPIVSALSHDGTQLYVVSDVLIDGFAHAVAFDLATLFVATTVELPADSACSSSATTSAPAFKVAPWSGNSIECGRFVYLTACRQPSLVVLDMNAAKSQYVSPAVEFTRTYSYNPITKDIIMNWGNRIVSVDPTTSVITAQYNVSFTSVAHDTMLDPVEGYVYIPMNRSSPAGVVVLDGTTLREVWALTLPAGVEPVTAFVQTIRSPFNAPGSGVVTAFSTPASNGGPTLMEQLLVVPGPTAPSAVHRALLPQPGASLIGSATLNYNTYRVLTLPSSSTQASPDAVSSVVMDCFSLGTV